MQTTIESPNLRNDPLVAVKKNEDSGIKLSESFYYFLLHEIIKYTYEALSQSIKVDEKLVANQCRLFFEKFGFAIGIKIHERLSIKKQRICKAEDCLKFVCKNLWDFLFFKQADRLQTNRKAEYMIMDKNLPPLRYAIQPPTAQNQLFCYSSKASLPFLCGIIRGVLTNFNLSNSVTADARNPPTYRSILKVYETKLYAFEALLTKRNSGKKMERFNVLYTRQKTQKYKKWNDGTLTCLTCNGMKRLKLYSSQDSEDKLIEAIIIVEAAWKAALDSLYIKSPLYLIYLLKEPVTESMSQSVSEKKAFNCDKKIVKNLHTTATDKCTKRNRKNEEAINNVCSTANSYIALPFLHLHHVYPHLKYPLLN